MPLLTASSRQGNNRTQPGSVPTAELRHAVPSSTSAGVVGRDGAEAIMLGHDPPHALQDADPATGGGLLDRSVDEYPGALAGHRYWIPEQAFRRRISGAGVLVGVMQEVELVRPEVRPNATAAPSD